jgi:hypothetical protein
MKGTFNFVRIMSYYILLESFANVEGSRWCIGNWIKAISYHMIWKCDKRFDI